MKLVSIIIPVFNRAPYLEELLDSIQQQTYHNWEVILVDDGSTDGSIEMASRFASIHSSIRAVCRSHELPKGANTCRNIGLELSKGDYVLFFDSDDVMHPEKLERQVHLLDQSNLDFVAGAHWDFVDQIEQSTCMNFRFNESVELNGTNFMLGIIYWITGDMMLRKSKIKNVRFATHLRSGQEYYFFTCLFYLNGLKGKFDPSAIYYRRIHPNSIQQKLLKKPVKAVEQKLEVYRLVHLTLKDCMDEVGKLFLEDRMIYFYGRSKLYRSLHYNLKDLRQWLERPLTPYEIVVLQSIDWFTRLTGKGDVLVGKILKKTILKRHFNVLKNYRQRQMEVYNTSDYSVSKV